MKTLARRLLVGCGSGLLVLFPAFTPPVLAFDKVWNLFACTNVPAGDGGLWDDAPGAGLNNESGFFWFVTDQSADENCVYHSLLDKEITASLKLSVRAAVNDGALLRVELREAPDGEYPKPCTGSFIASVTLYGSATAVRRDLPFTSSDSSQSEFITEWVELPDGQQLAEVCMTLDDSPNGVASERASALIDYIKIGQSLDPPGACTSQWCNAADLDFTTVWQETFQRLH